IVKKCCKYAAYGVSQTPIFFIMKEVLRMPNIELPIDLENQVVLMKKYVNFRQRKKMRDFLGYAGYFRASRYGKYLLTQVNVFGSRADSKVFFELYEFDVKLRLLLFKYCKVAEVYFKSAIANAVSLKTGDAGFYLDEQYYTPTKSEKDKKTRNRNVLFFHTKFFVRLKNDEEKLRRDVVKHPELKEYRRGGIRQNNVLPVWAAFSYLEMGTIVKLYSYLRGDLRKEILDYTYPGANYKKEVTKQMDTWLDAVRNLRNYCAHHAMLVGMTSSVVIPDNRDSADVLPDNTNLYSRLYALKKILPQKDAEALAKELDKLISKTKLDIYKMNILPANWKGLYDRTLLL
ncbi:MAG: Abi family protein, partial [Ruminococcus flavefaciens]|nr:Abi family protein [Ruminococcus flavefaciens]